MRLLLAGAYGNRNAGDDIPLLVLRQQLPDAHISVLVRHGDDTYPPDIRQVRNPEHETSAAAWGRRFRGLNPGDNTTALRVARKAIAEADAIVLGAGNWMTDISFAHWRGPMQLAELYTVLARSYGVPVVHYGLGIGPLDTVGGQGLAAWLLGMADLVTVRDARSLALARELAPGANARLVADACFGWRRIPGAEVRGSGEGGGADIGVSVRDLTRTGTVCDDVGGDGLDRLREVLFALQCCGQRLRFIPQSTYADDDDRAAASALGLQECDHIETRLSPDGLLDAYASCRAVLAVRLHGVVLAAMAGVPVVGLTYRPKVRAACEALHVPCFGLDAPARGIVDAVLEAAESGQSSETRAAVTVQVLAARDYGAIIRDAVEAHHARR